jgi:hypothetical protein
VRLSFVVQKEPHGEGRFTNTVAELALFGLEAENELFDWAWVDARRDPAFTPAAALALAPRAWRRWVSEGDVAIEGCRRRILRSRLMSPTSQVDVGRAEAEVLRVTYEHYRGDKHSFEGLASLVATRFLGGGCERGWVTKRSGDGGVDFVSRLTLGSGPGAVSLVVLGQAKCISPSGSISGADLARVVARLQRGWIGVFVTTGTYTRSAQLELYEDRYPLVLINGRRLAAELRMVTNTEGISLDELLAREDRWYAANHQRLDPGRILDLGSTHLNHLVETSQPMAQPRLRSRAQSRIGEDAETP